MQWWIYLWNLNRNRSILNALPYWIERRSTLLGKPKSSRCCAIPSPIQMSQQQRSVTHCPAIWRSYSVMGRSRSPLVLLVAALLALSVCQGKNSVDFPISKLPPFEFSDFWMSMRWDCWGWRTCFLFCPDDASWPQDSGEECWWKVQIMRAPLFNSRFVSRHPSCSFLSAHDLRYSESRLALFNPYSRQLD